MQETMKKIEKWSGDCRFAKLVQLHTNIEVKFGVFTLEGLCITWTIHPNESRVAFKRNGIYIGDFNLKTGKIETNSILREKQLRTLVNAINKGERMTQSYNDNILYIFQDRVDEAMKTLKEKQKLIDQIEDL